MTTMVIELVAILLKTIVLCIYIPSLSPIISVGFSLALLLD